MEAMKYTRLKDLHQESVSWRSELMFFQDEYHFFGKLLNSYKYVPDNKEDFELREELLRDFTSLRDAGADVQRVLGTHINNLGGIYEKEKTSSEMPYLEEHQAIGKRVVRFEHRFRAFKQKLFRLADHILESKKPEGPNN